MLTGDKLETATCTAKNAHLVTRTQDIHIFRLVSNTYVLLSRPVQVTKCQDRRGAEIRALFQQQTQTIYVILTQFFIPLRFCLSVCCLSTLLLLALRLVCFVGVKTNKLFLPAMFFSRWLTVEKPISSWMPSAGNMTAHLLFLATRWR